MGLSDLERKKYVTALVNSQRGAYIIGQALHIAVEEMEKVPEPHREISNIDDMKLIRDELFPLYTRIVQVKSESFG